MKKHLLFIFLFFSFRALLAQQPKPIIDTGMLFTWPHFVKSPIVSSNGDYVAYLIAHQYFNATTLVVQQTHGSWKREFIGANMDVTFFFSKDGRKIVWKNADTLFYLTLSSSVLELISGVASWHVPSLGRGEWLAYSLKQKPEEQILFNVVTEKKLLFDHVKEVIFNTTAEVFLANRILQHDSVTTKTIELVDLSDGTSRTIWSGGKEMDISSYCFGLAGKQLAFRVRGSEKKEPNGTLWYYNLNMDKAVLKVDNQTPGIPSGFLIEGALYFTGNGHWLLFDLQPPHDMRRPAANSINVDLWSYKDEIINPAQSVLSGKILLAAIDVKDNSKVVCIKNGDEDLRTNPIKITGNYAIVEDHVLMEPWWLLSPKSSCWLVSLTDGKRTLIKKECAYPPLMDFTFSPTGRWLVYWDSEKRNFIDYDLATGKSLNLTRSLPSVSDENKEISYAASVAPVAGWYAGDTALLLYDRYDIWQLDPAGKRLPMNLSGGYGAKQKVKLRLINEHDDLGQDLVYNGRETVLLTGFNTMNKYNGFFTINLGEKASLKLLTMGPYTYYREESQKPHFYAFSNGMKPVSVGAIGKNCWIIRRESATEYPNYFITDGFTQYKALTEFQPQKTYNWLTTELVTWTQFDGTASQGILYKPENFNPKMKYPVLFNYYEKLSHRLYEFPIPTLCFDNLDISWFVSRGYLVFTPDIHYSVASRPGGKTAGEAVYNSVVSAAQYLSKRSYVAGKKMAIQGHSFGGAETNYLVTHSKQFAAASEMAGGSDPISGYLTLAGIGFEENVNKQSIAEFDQGRMGATPWERPDLYRRNSAVLAADKTATPLLIVHNKKDGAVQWRQGIELYMALRRLGKKCWMLQYDGEGHALNRKNALDYTIRLTQFFDYYLKGTPPAKWMTEGIPAWLKGIETRYDIDNSGKQP